MNKNPDRNPFTPGSPAPATLFVNLNEGPGAYRFVNGLYPVYMYMESSLHD